MLTDLIFRPILYCSITFLFKADTIQGLFFREAPAYFLLQKYEAGQKYDSFNAFPEPYTIQTLNSSLDFEILKQNYNSFQGVIRFYRDTLYLLVHDGSIPGSMVLLRSNDEGNSWLSEDTIYTDDTRKVSFHNFAITNDTFAFTCRRGMDDVISLISSNAGQSSTVTDTFEQIQHRNFTSPQVPLGAGRIVHLSDGTLLHPFYTRRNNNNRVLAYSISVDNGKTWDNPNDHVFYSRSEDGLDLNEWHLAELGHPDTLLIMARNNEEVAGERAVYQFLTFDGGITWKGPFKSNIQAEGDFEADGDTDDIAPAPFLMTHHHYVEFWVADRSNLSQQIYKKPFTEIIAFDTLGWDNERTLFEYLPVENGTPGYINADVNSKGRIVANVRVDNNKLGPNVIMQFRRASISKNRVEQTSYSADWVYSVLGCLLISICAIELTKTRLA